MNTQPPTKTSQTWLEAALNELRELQASGVKLPMSPEEIVQIEAQGDLVDLVTGEILKGGAGIRVGLTEQGRQIIDKLP